MDVTLPDIRSDVITNRWQIADLAGSATYTQGGETVLPEQFRMGKVFLILGGITNGTVLLIPVYDVATGMLIWQDNATGAQVADGDLSTYTGRVLVCGL